VLYYNHETNNSPKGRKKMINSKDIITIARALEAMKRQAECEESKEDIALAKEAIAALERMAESNQVEKAFQNL
jgi:hypothetical protein